jgi:hypothetical protein
LKEVLVGSNGGREGFDLAAGVGHELFLSTLARQTVEVVDSSRNKGSFGIIFRTWRRQ